MLTLANYFHNTTRTYLKKKKQTVYTYFNDSFPAGGMRDADYCVNSVLYMPYESIYKPYLRTYRNRVMPMNRFRSVISEDAIRAYYYRGRGI